MTNPASSSPDPPYVCPRCRSNLCSEPGTLTCASCSINYPVEDGIADFTQGRYYDCYEPGQALSDEQRIGLEHEVSGSIARVRDFFLPLLAAIRSESCELRVLDCGCGNGLSVDLLNQAGIDTWGNDLSALRKWQWREREWRTRLVASDGAQLPFPDRFFDVVVSSGVLEHIGVFETRDPKYRVHPMPERDQARIAFLAELHRVIRPGGRIWLDFPNGAFPIDFWHGTTAGGTRWHWPNEGFLPTVSQIRSYLRTIDAGFKVRALSPLGRLQFNQVGRHWYGRLLSHPMWALQRLMAMPGMGWLAASPLNPFLVLEVSMGPDE